MPRGADDGPSDGRLRHGYFRNNASMRRISARVSGSRPWVCNRARSVRSTANGIDGSSAAPGERASPSFAARTGSSTGPSRQKIPLHRQLADLRVKITDLALMVPTAALAPVRNHLAKTINRLALPCANLVRMNLVLQRRSPEAFGRHEAPQVRSSPSDPRKTCVSCSSRIPPQSGEPRQTSGSYTTLRGTTTAAVHRFHQFTPPWPARTVTRACG